MPIVVYFLAVAVFAQGTSEFMLAGLLSDIAADLEITVPHAGLLTSAFAIGMIVGAPSMAIAGRRWPPRRTLSTLLLVFIAMHAVGAITDNYPMLLVSRVVAALTNAGFLAVTLSTVSVLVPADRTARAVAVILGGTSIALIAGVPGGSLLGALLGWRAALWAVVVISVPVVLVVMLFVPDRPAENTGPTPRLRTELTTLRQPSLAVPLALGALVNGATFCAFTYLAPLVTAAGSAGDIVPIVLALFGIGAFAGIWAAGRLADRHAPAVLAAGGPALFVGWVGFAALSAHPVVMFPGVVVVGGLSFAVGGTLITMSIRAAAGAPTLSGAFATASLNLGAAGGPVLGGLAYASALGAAGPPVVSVGLVLVATVVRVVWSVSARRRRRRPRADDRSG